MTFIIYDPQSNRDFLIPETSEELALWNGPALPNDIFFICGRVPEEEKAALLEKGITDTDRKFSFGADIPFYLSPYKIVIHPKLVSSFPEDVHWRETDAFARAMVCFLNRQVDRRRFPTFREVRQQKGPGKGELLLSGGGFAVAQKEEELNLVALKRSDKAGLWTSANGLSDGPHAGEREFLEEYCLVQFPEAGAPPVVYGFYVEGGHFSPLEAASIKRGQLEKITQRLHETELYTMQDTSLDLQLIMASPVDASTLGFKPNTFTVYADRTHVLETHGFCGIEWDNNTAGTRDVYLLQADPSLWKQGRWYGVDPEGLQRDGAIHSRDELVRRRMISSDQAFVTTWLAAQPHARMALRPNASASAADMQPSPH